MASSSVGRFMVVLGLGIAFLGSLLWIAGKANLPFGRLPGDFTFELRGVSCLIPLASSLLLSLLLTLLLNFVLRILNR